MPNPGNHRTRRAPSTRPKPTDKNKQVFVHPILYALFPVFFLYVPNKPFFDIGITHRPAVACILIVGLAWLGLCVVMRDTRRAAVTVSFVWILCFSFDFFRHFVELLSNSHYDLIGTAHYIILTSVAATAGVFIFSFWMRQDLHHATYLLNVIGTILICMSLSDLVVGRILQPGSQKLQSTRTAVDEGVKELADTPGQPDIYYIVLDAYGRSDQLDRLYGFDNSEFLTFLEENGYYVASGAAANYPQTLLSITSALNFDYLNQFFDASLTGVQDRRFMRHALSNNRTVTALRKAGYSITRISSPYYEADIVPADTVVGDWRYPTVFELALLDMTPIPLLLNRGGAFAYDMHRSRILFSLDQLAAIHQVPGPKFVYSHILYGHPPFVFGEDGSPVTPDRPYTWIDGADHFGLAGASRQQYIEGYRDQVRFLNGRLQQVLTAILTNSEQPPIIVLQGDHGPGLGTNFKSLEETDIEERYGIFSAYYLPREGNSDLYESVSPVNSFRIVFNRYFGTSYPLLEDKRYYAPLDRPYDFSLVDSTSAATNLDAKDNPRPVQ